MNVQVLITDVPYVGINNTILKWKYIKSDIIQDLALSRQKGKYIVIHRVCTSDVILMELPLSVSIMLSPTPGRDSPYNKQVPHGQPEKG